MSTRDYETIQDFEQKVNAGVIRLSENELNAIFQITNKERKDDSCLEQIFLY